MTTSVTVKVPPDASYTAQVQMLDQVPNRPPACMRAEVRPGEERTFHAHSTRCIEVTEQAIEAVEATPAAA